MKVKGAFPVRWIAKEENANDFLNDRGVWVESASSDPTFGRYQWNDTRRDYVSYNVGGGEYKRFFVKRKGMVIEDGVFPTNTEYWEKGSTVRTLVSNTAVIDNANIGGFLANMSVLQSQNGSLVLDGINGLIKLFHESGYSWQVLPDGRQVLGVYTNDATKGRHIQLDPEAKEIRIYNDEGTCVTNINGETIDSLDNLFGSANGNVELLDNNYGERIENRTTDKNDLNWPRTNLLKEEKQIGAFTTSGGSRLAVKGTITANANTTTTLKDEWYEDPNGKPVISPEGEDMNGNLIRINYASVSVIVKTYTDSMNVTPKQTKQVANISSNGAGEKSLQFNTSVDLNAGYHVIVISYNLECVGFQSNRGYATASWNITSVSYATDVYLSRLFANGVAYGSSANNFFAAMNVNGRMLVKGTTVNGGGYNCGFELSEKGLSTLYRGQLMKPVVTLWFGHYLERNGTASLSSANGLRSGDTPTLAKSSTGQFTISFPQSWKDMGVSAANLFVTAVGVDSGVIASVKEIAEDSCTILTSICTSAGATAANKYFRVKIEYMIP